MILVIGEALIDLIEDRHQVGAFNAIVGGANANVAIALARRNSVWLFNHGDRAGKLGRRRLGASITNRSR